MTDRKTKKRTFESALPNTLASLKNLPDKTLSLDDLTPAKYGRMSSNQRRELLNRLIDYLKSI